MWARRRTGRHAVGPPPGGARSSNRPEAATGRDCAGRSTNLLWVVACRLALPQDGLKPEGDIGRVATTERAERVLGWRTKVDLDEGLRRTMRWVIWDMQRNNRTVTEMSTLTT